MEYLSIFDSNKRNLNKTIQRSQKPSMGEYYLICETCILSNNNLLVTLRSPTKKTDPNKWDIVGGHVKFGETSREAAQREIKEELGLEIDPNKLVYMGTERNDVLFSDLFLLDTKINLSKIQFQKDEISAIKMVGYREFLRMLNGKQFSENVTNRLQNCLGTIFQYMCKREENGK